jgi:anti-sigma regulatory factor (Ser/Thr protein kinase)
MDLRAFVRDCVRARPVPAGVEAYAIERPEDVSAVRALVRGQAEAAGLATLAIRDLELAVSEVPTNALEHGRGPRRVWSYVEDGDLVCHVRDGGSGPPDPLTGDLPPDASSLRGRGLWPAHRLCDIVEIPSDDARNDAYLYVRVRAAAQIAHASVSPLRDSNRRRLRGVDALNQLRPLPSRTRPLYIAPTRPARRLDGPARPGRPRRREGASESRWPGRAILCRCD